MEPNKTAGRKKVERRAVIRKLTERTGKMVYLSKIHENIIQACQKEGPSDWAARPTTVPYAVFGDPQSVNLTRMFSTIRSQTPMSMDICEL
jgi:hypothetical protein